MFKLTKPIIAIYSTLILLCALGAFVAIISPDDVKQADNVDDVQQTVAPPVSQHLSPRDKLIITTANRDCDKAITSDLTHMQPLPVGFGKPERALLVAACSRLVVRTDEDYEGSLAAEMDAQYSEASHSLTVEYGDLRAFYHDFYRGMIIATPDNTLRPYYAAMAEQFGG